MKRTPYNFSYNELEIIREALEIFEDYGNLNKFCILDIQDLKEYMCEENQPEKIEI